MFSMHVWVHVLITVSSAYKIDFVFWFESIIINESYKKQRIKNISLRNYEMNFS